MEEFLNSLGIHIDGTYTRNGSYIIDLDNSEEFGKVYTILDKQARKFDASDKDKKEDDDDINESVEDDDTYIEELTDNQLVTVDEASISYAGDDYLITLTGDFNSDIYRLTCTEL